MVAMEKVDSDRQFASEKYSNQCKWDGFVEQILIYLRINASKLSNNVTTEHEKEEKEEKKPIQAYRQRMQTYLSLFTLASN